MRGLLFSSDFLAEGIRRPNRYRTQDSGLGYINALVAGDTDTVLTL